MSCSRGKAAPDDHTKLQLFADSAGYCQNPSCNTNLFLSVGKSEFHIAEMAHIISAGDKGPRADASLTPEEKGEFPNLILLCPNCHTAIDKGELEFPNELVSQWKSNHGEKIKLLFKIQKYADRNAARLAIEPILFESRAVFDVYGPMTEERLNPESEMPKRWVMKIHEIILPNNRKLLEMADANYELLVEIEKQTLELFRQHVLDFESKHVNGADLDALQYPKGMNDLFVK